MTSEQIWFRREAEQTWDEQQEELWTFIELSNAFRIAYQTEITWAMHEALVQGKPYLRPALMPGFGVQVSLPQGDKQA